MALIKADDGNNIYTWKSDDLRDVEISNINTMINGISSSIGKMKVYISASYETGFVTFQGIKIDSSRYPALFIGNGNGTPVMAACALHSAQIGDVVISDPSLSISVSNVTETTYDLIINSGHSWGWYALIVFYH